MKKINKKIAMGTLVFMICNFFIAPIANVYAESSTAVNSYITDISNKANDIDSKFTSSKESSSYENITFKYAVDNFYNEYSSFNNTYTDYLNSFGNSISVRKVLVDSNSPLLAEYDSKNIKDEVTSFTNVNDVTYYNSETGLEEVLITGTSLAELIKKTYFLEYYNKYNDFYINYDSYVNSYKSYYDEIINDYNLAKDTINSYILEINQFIKDELDKGNNPNVLYDGSSVTDKLNSYIEELDVTLDKVLSSSYNNDFDSIVSDSTKVKDYFFDNNKNITSDLLGEINDLKDEYKDNYDKLSNLFESASIDITSIDSDLINNLDKDKVSDFVSLFEDIYNLDSKYQLLDKKIDNYLDRMPSESSFFKSAFDDLEDYYSKINKEKVLDFYDLFIYNANLSDEDIVDALLLFDYLSNSQYKYLMNVKRSFYNISLIDDSKYKIKLTDNYLIINGLDNINKSLFSSNLNYNGLKFELVGTSDILNMNTILKLYDRDGKYLDSLKIIIKNDVNGDGLVNNKDVNLLKNKVLYQKFNSYDKIACDINDDNVLNINDVVELNKIVNNIKTSSGDKASFNINVTETFNYVTYNIYINSDGIVNGFEFNIKTSSNLKFVKIVSGKGVSYLNKSDAIRVVGLGTYGDNSLVLKITFKKNLDSNSNIIFELENGIITFDNLGYNDNLRYKDIIKYQDKVEEVKNVNLSNDSSINSNNSNQKNLTLEEDDSKALDSSKKSKTDEEKKEESDIVWGNVIKIAIIVLLGALIIYFLNKDAEIDFEEDTDKDNNSKNSDKKEDEKSESSKDKKK
ncbi:MAG: hypothetical protein ACI31R_04685 [Bacilli bacterium]